MVNHVLTYSLLFIIMAMIITWPIEVEGGACSEPLGACGPIGQCDQRCKAAHAGGEGSCDLNLCTCYYTCGSSTPTVKKCNAGLGLCSGQCNEACCNANCASKYNQGTGLCNTIGTSNLCTCQYVCG